MARFYLRPFIKVAKGRLGLLGRGSERNKQKLLLLSVSSLRCLCWTVAVLNPPPSPYCWSVGGGWWLWSMICRFKNV
ncbi:hypothetical protein Hdeb2414_s0651g00929681 [Helianthus debilis subsp. tardiflorus]